MSYYVGQKNNKNSTKFKKWRFRVISIYDFVPS